MTMQQPVSTTGASECATRTTCAYCGVGCGITATVTGPRSISISGDPDHPANRGSLCSKGTHLGETVGLEGRLLHPMIGDKRVTWDDALEEVASRMRECIEQHGPDSVALYVSGQLLTEDYYLANKLAKGFIGTANIDTNSRLCMASAVAAHNRAFGEDVVPCTYDDLDAADLIVLVGSNTAWCHPVIWQRIEAARERRGTRLVVIDPRRTETAQGADLHLAIAPDGDVALFNALLGRLFERGAIDQNYLAEHCATPSGFWDSLDCDPGIPADEFDAFVELVARHPRMVTLFSQGANQSVGGTDKGNAIINLHLATGRINREGAGPFSITGQPNAMGGREVGGLANMLACHLGFSDEEREAVAGFWQTKKLCTEPGLKAVEMFRAVHSGQIKFLWVMATNPAVSMPDAGFVREALARCPTVVVSDIIAETDTARLAHIRLPALGWGEKDGTVTNSERMVSRQRALFAPPGEARADWEIIAQVGQRLGYGEAFAFENAAGVFREYAAMTGLAAQFGKRLDLTEWQECSDASYEMMQPFRWGGAHPFSSGFSTATGKAQLVAVAVPAKRVADKAFPLRLNSGRYRDQWHTMTRTGLSPLLSQHRREPLLEIAPCDAKAYGLADGGLARVTTDSGTSIYRVSAVDSQAPGEVFVPMHFTDQNSGGGRTGRLIDPVTDPISGQPAFKNVAASVAVFVPDWRAFLVTRADVVPDCSYWSRARIKNGWLYELAGMATIETECLLPSGRRNEVSDRARGMLRITVEGEEGELAAALYVTRNGKLPARDWIERQFAAPDGSFAELLAGRPSVPMPDRGPLVCVCHDVGENAIFEAVSAGADSVKAVGKKTCAGTNCGSCRPLIATLLEAAKSRTAEEAL